MNDPRPRSRSTVNKVGEEQLRAGFSWRSRTAVAARGLAGEQLGRQPSSGCASREVNGNACSAG